jgi:hypothetical protein
VKLSEAVQRGTRRGRRWLEKRTKCGSGRRKESAKQDRKEVLKMDLCDAIAHVAYELYEGRGKSDGHDLDDWLEAERIVLSWNRGGDQPS